MQFYKGIIKDSCAVCKINCVTLKINREEFIKLIKQNNKDFETFHMIKDSLLIEYQNEWNSNFLKINKIIIIYRN